MKKPESITLQLAANTAETVSLENRTITGLAVPYGPVGNSSLGPITFSQGDLTYSAVGRVKFLKQHDPERSLGFAKELNDLPEGMRAAIYVPESPEGDEALLEAADGRRDGLSVGVLLSQETIDEIVEKRWNGDNSPTAAKGELLEISQVSIPAFRDSRIDGSAAAALSGHVTLSVDFGGANQGSLPVTFMEKEMTVETSVSAPATSEVETPAPAPAAFAGHAVIESEAPVYTFDGKGPSFVRDAFNAKFSMDRAAEERLVRFNEMMARNEAGQVGRVTAAVETRTTLTNYIQQGYKPEMLVAAIDKGRPLVSRHNVITLTDATPFRIPTEGDFTGVGDHTEGTAHAAEGDLTAGDVLVTPGAVSGAYRISRELIDASNPALDQVAVRAMARNYRSVTEGKVAAAYLAADGVATLNIDKVNEVRQELNNFYDIQDEPASFIASSTSYVNTLLADVDTTGRPMLATYNPMNAVGLALPGSSGYSVDGVEFVKSSQIAVNDAFIVNADDVLVGESALQTFRFDEVEGPGVVKLALWAYFVATVLRASSVVQITSAAA